MEGQSPDRAGERMLALSLFHTRNLDLALPAVIAALQKFPTDLELNNALLAMQLAAGDYTGAEATATTLENAGAVDEAAMGRAKIAMVRGDTREARTLLDGLIAADNTRMAQKAAGLLIDDLMAAGRAAAAHEAAQRAIARDPDSFYAFRFSKLRAVSPANRPLKYNVGYRFEYDDNVALLPDNSGPIGEFIAAEDSRHVLTGDILYRKGFAENWSFFAEGHLSQSLYHDITELNFTGVNVLAGIGQSFERWGWRMPVEFIHDRFDGDAFRDAWIISPGVYIKLSESLFLSFNGKFQADDYEFAPTPQDDRSGDVTGGNLTLSGRITDKFGFRTFINYNDYDADGRFWPRDETTYYLSGDYQLAKSWKLGLALQRRDMKYDNVTPPNFTKQKDESTDVFLTLSHSFAKVWSARGLVSVVKSESNIEGLDFDRNVYSLSINRQF